MSRIPALITALLILVTCAAQTVAAGAVDAAALLDEARELATGHNSAADEQRLYQIITALAVSEITPATRELMRDLSDRAVTHYVPHEEGSAMIPAVDVGALARATLRYWRRLAAASETTIQKRNAQASLVDDYLRADRDQRAGILDAVARSTPADLAVYRDEILRQIHVEGADALASEIGLILSDDQLLTNVLTQGSPSVALRLLPALQKNFDEYRSLLLLRSALQRSDIASAAILQIGLLRSDAADALLWELLEHPQYGSSAAAALAKNADGITLRRLADLLETHRDLLTQRRAALALSLSDDATANAIAQRWRTAQ